MKVDEVKAFMAPILAKAPVEIVIVGDITVDRAIDGVAKTFGALPAREERRATDESKIVKFPAATPMPIVLNHKGRADQALAVVAWPNGGYRDRDGSAPLRLAQLVLQDRLFDELRVKQGKTYSPSSDVFTNSAFPDYGYTMVQTETPPETIAGVLATIDQIAADLAEKDVTPDELDRARKPRIESWGRNFRTNGYWIGALAGAQLDPDLLDNPRTIVPRLQAVTAADVRKAAKAYLVKDRAWRMTVVPEVKVAQATAN